MMPLLAQLVERSPCNAFIEWAGVVPGAGVGVGVVLGVGVGVGVVLGVGAGVGLIQLAAWGTSINAAMCPAQARAMLLIALNLALAGS